MPTLERDLAVPDLTDPRDGPHALQRLVDAVAVAVADRADRAGRIEVRFRRGERVVTTAENYDLLGFPPDVVTRDARYTRYIDDDHLLRSHTSAIVPPSLAELGRQVASCRAPEDVVLVCPGICFRRDSIDRLHTGTPHQLDVWRVARRPLGAADLETMIEAVCAATVGNLPRRYEPRAHPYTRSGSQVDVQSPGGDWVEVAECGLAHEAVLARCGLDGSWSGLALGMGLDRLLMLMKGIPDIRLLRSGDPRVRSQMMDLSPYRPVSPMPAVVRDLSMAVAAGAVEDEELGDRVREALGGKAEAVESVAVLSVTSADALSAAARERLGIGPGQVNVLVRVVLRALDHTLADDEANRLRDAIFAAIHEGAVSSWAAPADRAASTEGGTRGEQAGGR